MTLVFDERARLKQSGEPGLHAFITGASAYPHLPGGGDTPAPNSYGMQQLTATARSAYKVYKWLLLNKDSLPVPLATVRLLLSPSPGEVAEVAVTDPTTNNPVAIDRATRARFVREAKNWRKDAMTRKDNHTFFYFAGHGVQNTNKDAAILLEDFGDDDGGTLDKTASSANLYDGMAPSDKRPDMARTQFYFIDACQAVPPDFFRTVTMKVPDIWDVDLSGTDDRVAPVFNAAVSGSLAYSLPNTQTLFNMALLDCLNGKAGDRAQDGRWRVTLGSLMEALKAQFVRVLLNTPGAKVDQQKYGVGGQPWDLAARLVNLADTPELDFTIELVPPDAQDIARLQIRDAANNNVLPALPSTFAPNPFPLKLRAGLYRIVATIDPPTPPYINVDNPNDLYQYKPPTANMRVQVTQ